MQITKVKIFENYLIAQQSGEVDYKDNFQLKTDLLTKSPEPKDCMIAFFRSFPPIFIKLLLF